MKLPGISLNQFERAVGIFVFGAMGVFLVTTLSLAIKQGWFDKNIHYHTYYEEAEGLNPGAVVLVGGVKAGSVDRVDIEEDNSIHVHYSVKAKFAQRIRSDSIAQISRPFVIGEKQINISLGTNSSARFPTGGILKGEESMDLMDLLSGKKLAPYLKTLETLASVLTRFAEEIKNGNKNLDLVAVFSELLPTLQIAQDALKRFQSMEEGLQNMHGEIKIIRKDFIMTQDMKRLITGAGKATTELVPLSQALADMTPQLTGTLKDISKMTPEILKMTPELLLMTQQTLKTLYELNIVLRAAQKSFLLSSSVKEVREEMKKESDKEKNKRAPASK